MAKAENKIAVGFTISISLCIIIVLFALYGAKLLEIFKKILSLGLDDNGRMEIYQNAIDTFKKFPLFGAGWDYRIGEMAHDGYSPYWYHNTVLQIMANMGITGLLFYTLFAFWRYSSCLLTKNYRVPKLTIAAGLILFELYGMVDVVFFGPTFFICMVIMSFVVEKSLDNNQCNPLLFNKFIKKLNCKNKIHAV